MNAFNRLERATANFLANPTIYNWEELQAARTAYINGG